MSESFVYRRNRLHVEGVPLDQIAKEVGTPCYIYSAARILDRFHQYQDGLKGIPSKICYAVKTNSNLAILDLLREAGAGMDIVSGGELFRVGEVGVPGSSVVFSGVGKSEEEIKDGLDYRGKGIFSFNIESLEELAKIQEVARDQGKTAHVAIRYNPDVNPGVHKHVSTGKEHNKFGIPEKEVLRAVQTIKDMSHVQLRGISIHIGSNIQSLTPFEKAFKKTKALLDKINRDRLEPLTFVDLGGGLGVRYDKEKTPSIKSYCALIKKIFKGATSPDVFIEPGRSLNGDAGVLLTSVIYRKSRSAREILVVDGSMTELIRPALYDSFHEILPVKKTSGRRKKSDVVGPVCESADFLGRDRMLPMNLESGDHLAVMTAGAMGMSMASHYNTRPKCAEVLVKGKDFQVVRERERYADLIRGEKTAGF